MWHGLFEGKPEQGGRSDVEKWNKLYLSEWANVVASADLVPVRDARVEASWTDSCSERRTGIQ